MTKSEHLRCNLFTRHSKANQIAFDRAVDEVATIARQLLDALVTTAPPRNRDDEAAKARARAVERYRPAPNAATRRIRPKGG